MAISLQHEDEDGHDWDDQTALFASTNTYWHETKIKTHIKKVSYSTPHQPREATGIARQEFNHLQLGTRSDPSYMQTCKQS